MKGAVKEERKFADRTGKSAHSDRGIEVGRHGATWYRTVVPSPGICVRMTTHSPPKNESACTDSFSSPSHGVLLPDESDRSEVLTLRWNPRRGAELIRRYFPSGEKRYARPQLAHTSRAVSGGNPGSPMLISPSGRKYAIRWPSGETVASASGSMRRFTCRGRNVTRSSAKPASPGARPVHSGTRKYSVPVSPPIIQICLSRPSCV